jgi:DNA-binding transcriptional LysR family regulator
MDLKRLKTFARVADTLNFSEAARQLHRTQSSVAEQIQALEVELGVALFDRSHRKLVLTAAGNCLRGYASRMIALADEAREAVLTAGGIERHVLDVGGIETIAAGFLTDVVARMAASHPNVNVRLAVASTSELQSKVQRGTLDVAFFFGTRISDDDLACKVIAHEPLVLIVPADHRLASRASAGHDDIVQERFLVTGQGCAYRKMFETAFQSRPDGQPDIAGEFDSVATIIRLVGRGLGCAIVPRMAPSIADRDLAIVPWQAEAATVPVSMAYRKRLQPSPSLAALLAAVETETDEVTRGGGHRPGAPPNR